MISEEAKREGIKYGKEIFAEIKAAQTGTVEAAEGWSNEVGGLIRQAEMDFQKAKEVGNTYLMEKIKDGLDRLNFEAAELAALSDLIRDKALLEIAKKAAQKIAKGVFTALLTAG